MPLDPQDVRRLASSITRRAGILGEVRARRPAWSAAAYGYWARAPMANDVSSRSRNAVLFPAPAVRLSQLAAEPLPCQLLSRTATRSELSGVGITGADEVARHEQEHNNYSTMTVKALADLSAEALASSCARGAPQVYAREKDDKEPAADEERPENQPAPRLSHLSDHSEQKLFDLLGHRRRGARVEQKLGEPPHKRQQIHRTPKRRISLLAARRPRAGQGLRAAQRPIRAPRRPSARCARIFVTSRPTQCSV